MSAIPEHHIRRSEAAPEQSPNRLAQLIPHPASFPQSSHDVRYKPQRDLLNIWRYAAAVLWLRPDGEVEMRRNTDPLLHVVAILVGDGTLAAEISYHRQRPYGNQSVGPKDGDRLSIKGRRPLATLTDEQAALLAPTLAQILQEVTDQAVLEGYMKKQPRKCLTANMWVKRPWTVRGGHVAAKYRPSSFENGTLWRVALRDGALLRIFRSQCDMEGTKLRNALGIVARRIKGLLARYDSDEGLQQGLERRFALPPNDRWLESLDMLPHILSMLSESEAERTMDALCVLKPNLLPICRTDIEEDAAALRIAPPQAYLDALRVRRRNAEKQARRNELRSFEVLPSAALVAAAESADIDGIRRSRTSSPYPSQEDEPWFDIDEIPVGADCTFDPTTFA